MHIVTNESRPHFRCRRRRRRRRRSCHENFHSSIIRSVYARIHFISRPAPVIIAKRILTLRTIVRIYSFHFAPVHTVRRRDDDEQKQRAKK